MLNKKAVKVAGFVGALCASAALVATAANGTGAYFTDSHTGTMNVSSGHLVLNVTDTTLNFQDLVPGQYQTKDIGYSTSSNSNEDIWLVFDQNDPAYQALTGPKTNSFGGGLGRYGHFAVAGNGTTRFTSYNLQLPPAGGTDVCPVDAVTGNGGSNQQASSPTDTPPLCGIPSAIKLVSNVPSGSSGHIQVTFGVTGKWTAQNAPIAPGINSVPFKIVATQPNVSPDPSNNF